MYCTIRDSRPDPICPLFRHSTVVQGEVDLIEMCYLFRGWIVAVFVYSSFIPQIMTINKCIAPMIMLLCRSWHYVNHETKTNFFGINNSL